jgi:hypothetical protein
MELPLIAKDTIKDALMMPDVETSRQLGRAAVVAVLAVAEPPRGAVIESNDFRERTRASEMRVGVVLYAQGFYEANGYEVLSKDTAWDGNEFQMVKRF